MQHVREPESIMAALHVDDEKIARQVLRVHQVYTAALAAMPWSAAPQYLTLSQLAMRKPGISEAEWLSAINENVLLPVTSETVFYLADERVLDVVTTLVDTYGYNVYPFAYWMLVFVHCYFASASSHRLQTSFHDYRSRCFLYMTYLAPHAENVLITEYMVATDEIETAKHIYRRIKDIFPTFLKWTGNKTREWAIRRFNDVTLVLGVPSDFYSPAAMNREYRFLPTFDGPFAENLMAAYKARADLELFKYAYSKTPLKMHRDLTHVVYPKQAVTALFYPYTHAVHVSSAYLSDMRVIEGSLAASYAITGRTLGHELAHAFDRNNLWADPDGLWKDTELNRTWTGYEDRVNCIVRLYDALGVRSRSRNYSTSTLAENFADLAGMEMALAAMESDSCVKLDAQSPIDGFTNRQLFYLAHCFQFCATRDVASQSSDDLHAALVHRCNTVLGASVDFRKAFRCPVRGHVSCPVLL